jgi:hypothetical protein
MSTYPATPSDLNYTIGLPTAVYFDDGTGERHLGNIVAARISPVVEEVPHFASSGGTRQTDATLTRIERLSIEGTFDEPDVHNLSAVLLGGTISNVDGGTTPVEDKAITASGVQWASLGYPEVSNVSVGFFPDNVLMDSTGTGETFTDHTSIAQGGPGTPFSLMTDTDDDLYVGSERPFGSLLVNIATPGVGYAFTVKYFNGTTWTTVSNLDDGTSDFEQDGVIAWTVPNEWSLVSFNDTQLYWLKFEATAVTTAATCDDMVRTFVENDDYVVDPTGGKIRRIDGSDITDGGRIFVDFEYATPQGKTFAPGVTLKRSGQARLVFSPQVGAGFEYRMWKVVLKPGTFTFDAEDWIDFPLTIDVLADTVEHPDEPFGRITHTGVSS